MAMNPTSRDHQQKREQRRHGTHATSLSHASAELLDTTGTEPMPPVYRTPRPNCWTLRARNPCHQSIARLGRIVGHYGHHIRNSGSAGNTYALNVTAAGDNREG